MAEGVKSQERAALWLIPACLAVLLLVFGLLFGYRLSGSTKPVVKIGLVAPFEGLYRPLGYKVLYGVKLALRDVNRAGGIEGYMVELVALDDGNDPAEAARQAQEMALDPDVVGVIGHLNDAATMAAAPLYHRHGLVMITPAAARGEIVVNGWNEIYRLWADGQGLGIAAAEYAVTGLGARRLAVVEGGGESSQAFRQRAQEMGAEVVADLEAGEPHLVKTLAKAQPDLIFFDGGSVAGGKFLVRAREGKLPGLFLGTSTWSEEHLLRLAGAAAEGVFYVAPGPSPEAWAQFAQSYRALANQEPSLYAVAAYDATNILVKAIGLSVLGEGRPTRQGVLAAMKEVEPYQGVMGQVEFDGRGQWLVPTLHLYHIVGGRLPGEIRSGRKSGRLAPALHMVGERVRQCGVFWSEP
ncbi:MAG: branched-chain amino acid ABC transporter substrate-binding protein [Anaerolineae bacterium]